MASSSANLWVLLGLGIAGILIMTKKLKRTVKADLGAFIERLQLLPPPQPAPPKAPHPLTGLSFAVSDVFNIEGFVTGFGNPDWLRTHEAAPQTCPVVAALVDGGATCVGKTVVDDMALGVSGESKHYGSPTNPASPARVPGGASSGAAVAVAAKLVDFSLGIDTDGGVRVPAGYCGILGFRPSHGTVSLSGVIPVSGSLDAVGWFAKDPSVLRRVGHVLLQVPYAAQRNPRNIVIADDCFQLSKVPAEHITQMVVKSVEKLYGRQVLRRENLGDYINLNVPSLSAFNVKQLNGEGRSPIRLLANVMQILKRHEFKQNHDEWINSVKPSLDPVILAQIPEVSDLTDADVEKCNTIRSELRSAINALLKVAVPLGVYEKCPVSLSLLARHGGDRFLLDTLQTVYGSLQEQADTAGKPKSSSKAVTQETSAEMAKEKGNQAFKDKQWQRAIGFYTEAIKLNSSNATYYSNRAAAYLEMGSFIQAEADCTQAIDLDKKVLHFPPMKFEDYIDTFTQNVKAYLRGTAREMWDTIKKQWKAPDQLPCAVTFFNFSSNSTFYLADFRYALVLEPNNRRAAQSLDRLKKLFQ
ncbi:UNVERIFIED_CONTAM: Outer envelope protein 64, chloroplastic [Sesamum angustifolium]|uniref:Outer envelope protein 64, chloroplastic n=1 Tax=Sesamum angustifolium TaxID=2727405 RepID=A0AAW2RJ99_9LAMI